jgi:RNA polymerase sigma-70 factor (ECF subfamily)
LENSDDFSPVTERHQSCILPAHLSPTELNDLFAFCMPGLRRVTKRMLRNPQDSEDALQEGLLLAVRKLRQFEGRSSFSTWLHAIVRNTSRMYYRKNGSHPTTPIGQPWIEGTEPRMEECPVEQRPSPEEMAIRHERSHILRGVTRELPVSYQTAIVYFYLDGLGEYETAKRLGVTESSVKARLHRSRRILTCRIREICMPKMKASSRKPETLRLVSVPRAPSRKKESIPAGSSTEARMV